MNAVTVRTTDGAFVPGPYFSKGYGVATVAGSSARWITLYGADGLWQMPLILRRAGSGEAAEAVSPYGYAGIHIDESLTPATIQELWRHSMGQLRGLGVVSLFLRFAPFSRHPLEAARGLPGLRIDDLSKTIIISTERTQDVWKGMKGRARTAVRKAVRAGYSANVEVASSVSTGSFRRLYENTMLRVGASSDLVYPDEYYQELIAALGPGVLLFEVKSSDEQTIAASLVLVQDGILHYHLSGSDTTGAKNGANNLLVWSILEWAAQNDFNKVHLGGGLRPGDALFSFKASFGGSTETFSVGKVVVDEPLYESLTQLRASQLGVTPEKLRLAGYFPSYRVGVENLE